MSTESQIVSLTSQQWLELRGDIAQAGVTISADQGSYHKDMTDITWAYNGTGLTVTTSGMFAGRAMDLITEAISKVKRC